MHTPPSAPPSSPPSASPSAPPLDGIGGLLPPPEEVLPHRAPFLFIDRVTALDERRAVAWRRFEPTEHFFAGHFPGRPIVPGVIIIEALAQTLAYWALRARPGHWVLLTGVEEARFSGGLAPGDEARLEVEVRRARLGLVVADARCLLGEREVARATIKGFLQAREEGEPSAPKEGVEPTPEPE